MHLKRLDIHGFKSFAQKVQLDFEPGITAIVGPNGSGKSNVADSLRWVLGEQSAKQLRGKKSDDVIFAGSDKRAKGGFAEVFATFDNSDRRIHIDAAEVSIGRRVDRSGESEYLINGNKVRLLDIVDLVLKSNIGTSRYTVIGQGTIDQLILAGPTEIKGLLDEASGVKTYQVRREKTLKRLDVTAQNLMRAEDVVAELEPRLKSLRRQAKRQESREGLELELKVLLRERLGGAFFELSKHINEVSSRVAVLVSQRQVLETQLVSLQSMIEEDTAGGSKEATEVASLRRDMVTLQEQKNKLLEQRSILQGKMASSQTGAAGDPRSLQLQTHQLELKLATLSNQQDVADKELTEAQEQMRVLTEQRASLEKQFAEFTHVLTHKDPIQAEELERAYTKLEEAVDSYIVRIESALDVLQVQEFTAEFKNAYSALKQHASRLLAPKEADEVPRQEQMQQLYLAKSKLEQEFSVLSGRRASAETSVKLLAAMQQELLQEHLNVRLELQKATSGGLDGFIEQLNAEFSSTEEKISSLQVQLRIQEERLANFDAEDAKRRQSLTDAERRMRVMQDEINKLRDAEVAVSVEKAKFDTQAEGIIAEIKQVFGEEVGGEIMRTAVPSTTADLEDKISKLRHQLELIGGVDEMTMQEYRETEERFTRLSEQIADLRRSMDDLKQVMDELDEHIKTRFNEAFYKINERFENYFRVLFNGGRAQLSLVKAQEEKLSEQLEESEEKVETEQLRPEEKLVRRYESGSTNIVGVDMKATPPGKKLANIQALSGGERALTSIALLCSLLACFPSPFVVLDEVDAALDEANTIRFGQILATLAHQTQFVTITHNRETMAQSKMLYGVTMGDDSVSKILSIKFDQATAFAK